MPVVNIGVIGTGNAARQFHVPTPGRSDKFKLLACADAIAGSAKTFAEEYSIDACDTPEELVRNDEIDLVVIATKPPTTHRDLALLAIEHGKHVVVEKPMAETSGECTEMIDAARAAGTVLSVHHNRRWDVDFLNARDALLQGVLGELKLLRNDYSAGYEGSVYDWGIHIIDQTMMLSEGMAFVGISATMAKPNRDNPTEGEGFFSANLVREDGALYQMGMLPVIQGNAFRPGRMTPRFMLAGTKGVMIQDWCQTPMDGFGAGVRFEAAEEGSAGFGNSPSLQASLAIPEFYDELHGAITKGSECPVTGESARRSVRAWELVCRAAVERRSIDIEL
jgi:scyllo-inositol 2-dehydrogenase (NADP+)